MSHPREWGWRMGLPSFALGYVTVTEAAEWRYASRMTMDSDCELCTQAGGELLWENDLCRVVRVTDASGRRLSGLLPRDPQTPCRRNERSRCRRRPSLMDVVLATERGLRKALRPDKINLASLGNMVPHLHWHVVPRWRDDSHFPAPIWAAAQARRSRPTRSLARHLRQAIAAELSTVTGLAMNFELPPTGTEQPPAFTTAAACQDWLAPCRWPMPCRRNRCCCASSACCTALPLPTGERFKILEALRAPLVRRAG
jgi:hypothetical protein